MLDVLVASNPRRHAGFAELATSMAFHAGLLTLAVLATRVTVETVREIVADTTLVFLPRLAAPQVDKAPPPAGRGGGGGGNGALIIATNPPPRGFQVIEAIGAVPTDIPPVDPHMRAFDPRDFTGRGVEGGVGWGVVGGTGEVTDPPPEFAEMLYSADSRDAQFIPAEMVQRPTFEYPIMLRDAGIPGRVLLQFVIDTLGQVEPATVKVLEQSHAAFGAAARAGLLGAHFEPARHGTRVVRQLSKLPVSFAVAPS